MELDVLIAKNDLTKIDNFLFERYRIRQDKLYKLDCNK